MIKHVSTCVLFHLAIALTAFADGTVTLELSSPSNGATVAPGQDIEWTITAEVEVSDSDNFGLALILVDLVQDPQNPHSIELAPAIDVPPGMEGFNRPEGICNPGPGGVGSGYGGTPLGPVGATDLAQIGGAQNSFGVPGSEMGWDVNIDSGVGQAPGGQVIATGTFAAPAAPGSYTILLSSALANTLDELNPPGDFSAVSPANVPLETQYSITFTVSDCPYDLTGDNTVDASDLGAVLGAWGPNPGHPADFNGDGVVAPFDLAAVLGAWGPCD